MEVSTVHSPAIKVTAKNGIDICGKLLYWPFDDPEAAEGSEEDRLEKFREVRDQIRSKIEEWLESDEA